MARGQQECLPTAGRAQHKQHFDLAATSSKVSALSTRSDSQTWLDSDRVGGDAAGLEHHTR